MSDDFIEMLSSPAGQEEMRRNYVEGATDACRQLLRAQIDHRDELRLKADLAREILQDAYEGNPLASSGSYTVAVAAIKYDAQADAAQDTQDDIEAMLQALTESVTRALVTATGRDSEGG